MSEFFLLWGKCYDLSKFDLLLTDPVSGVFRDTFSRQMEKGTPPHPSCMKSFVNSPNHSYREPQAVSQLDREPIPEIPIQVRGREAGCAGYVAVPLGPCSLNNFKTCITGPLERFAHTTWPLKIQSN